MVDGSGSPGSGAGEDGRIPDAGGGRLTRIEAAMVLGVIAFSLMGMLSGELRWSLFSGWFVGCAAYLFDWVTERRG